MRGFPAHTIPSFLLFVFGAEKDDDEVGLVVIKLCEIDVKVRSREFGGVPAVIEDLLTCDVLSEKDGDGFDAVAMLAGEGERNTEAASGGFGHRILVSRGK